MQQWYIFSAHRAVWNQKQWCTVQGLVMCRDTWGIRKSEATATLSLSYPIRHTNTNMNTLTDTGGNTNSSTLMNTITVQDLVMCSDMCVHRIRRSRDIAEPRAPASTKIQRSLLLLLECYFLSFFLPDSSLICFWKNTISWLSTSLKNILIKHSFTIDCILKEFVYSFLVSALQRNNGFAPVTLRFATAYGLH